LIYGKKQRGRERVCVREGDRLREKQTERERERGGTETEKKILCFKILRWPVL
jgi:hypothetical protein